MKDIDSSMHDIDSSMQDIKNRLNKGTFIHVLPSPFFFPRVVCYLQKVLQRLSIRAVSVLLGFVRGDLRTSATRRRNADQRTTRYLHGRVLRHLSAHGRKCRIQVCPRGWDGLVNIKLYSLHRRYCRY